MSHGVSHSTRGATAVDLSGKRHVQRRGGRGKKRKKKKRKRDENAILGMKMKRELEIILLQHQVKVFHCFCSPLLATLLILSWGGRKN